MRQLRADWLGDLAILQAARALPEPVINAVLRASEREGRDAGAVRRTRRAIELLGIAELLPMPGGGLHLLEVTRPEIVRALRHTAEALPPGDLRARMDLVALRLTHGTQGARAHAVALARIAALVDDAGAPDAARQLARLARRAGQSVNDESITRSVVLSRLSR